MILDILEITKDDVFLDIGHGIGNSCFQAAYTTGCDARGIEVVKDRNDVALVFKDLLEIKHKQRGVPRQVGTVTLRHGRLEDPNQRSFLTEDVTKVFCNNYNGVFAERSSKVNQAWFLDHYVAALFATMAPGTCMVTFHPLTLGPTMTEANLMRERNNLAQSRKAGFYSVEKVELGRSCDSVKWNQHSGNKSKIHLYKYTRLQQDDCMGPVLSLIHI